MLCRPRRADQVLRPMPFTLLTPMGRLESILHALRPAIQAVQVRLLVRLQLDYRIILRSNAQPSSAFRRHTAVRTAILELLVAPYLAALRGQLTTEEYQCLELLYHALAADIAESWYVRDAKRHQLVNQSMSSEERG